MKYTNFQNAEEFNLEIHKYLAKEIVKTKPHRHFINMKHTSEFNVDFMWTNMKTLCLVFK
jgi:hypothetical protein